MGTRTPSRSESLPAYTASSAGSNEYIAIMVPMVNWEAPSSIANSEMSTLLARKLDMLHNTIRSTVPIDTRHAPFRARAA